MHMIDEEMLNSNSGIFYNSPGWRDKDFYSFLLLQRVYGGYSQERNAAHIGDVHQQFNSMHALLAECPDILRHDCIYSPYSDCGFFGHYIFGNDSFVRQQTHVGEALSEVYGEHFDDVEVIRAKSKLFMELLSIDTTTDALQQIGPQMLYLNRRVPKSEIAMRASSIDNKHLRQVCNKWLTNSQPSITNWG